MQKDILLAILEKNRSNTNHFCKGINEVNMNFRLSKKTASVGFIYRHIGETTILLCQSFGIHNDVEATTIGKEDAGTKYDLETSKKLVDLGYQTLENIINNTPADEWLEKIDAIFFGAVSRIDLFSIIIFHNSHHCGQIASAIVKGE